MSSRLTMSTIGPLTPAQPLMSSAVGRPPSWIRTTIASTLRCLRSRTSALAVSASSRKSNPATPDGLTMFGVPSRVMPMNATLAPLKFWIEYGGNSVLPVASLTTLAARNSKSAPPKPSPSRQPSTGWQPPFCIRRSSVVPSSNSWLPTALRSSPIVVHRLDGRLVVEQARQQRAGADQVTGRHDDRVAVRLLERLHVRRQELGAASQRGRSRRGRSSRRGAGGFRGSR